MTITARCKSGKTRKFKSKAAKRRYEAYKHIHIKPRRKKKR